MDSRLAFRSKTTAKIHPADLSARLSLERAVCEGWANGRLQRALEQRPATGLLGPTEFPQSTRVDLPSAALLALASSGDMEVAVDLVQESWFMYGTMGQAQLTGGTPRAQAKEVIAADYAPDGRALAIVRRANRKVQLEYPEGKVIYATAGYIDYVRVSPSGKEVAFAEHPVYGDDRGWVSFVDETGNHKQLTREFGTIQGLAWSRAGKGNLVYRL